MESALIFGAVIAVVFFVTFTLTNGKTGGSNNDDLAVSPSKEDKLDKIYDVLNHIRWIGLGIGGMFALTFILPQCTGG